jgi:hypothetical protein
MNDPFVAKMASISNRINNLLPIVSGFQLVKKWDVGASEDNCNYVQYAGLYRPVQDLGDENEKGLCVLAFSSMALGRKGNRTTNFGKDKNVSWCGFEGVHEGYAERAGHFHNGSRFTEFDEFIRGHCAKLALVGHSMGGALATLVAACAYKKADAAWNWPEDPHIYTFGAPAVATTRIAETEPAVFKGYRFFNKDKSWRDPIPVLSRRPSKSPERPGFLHPKLSAFQIQEIGFGAKHLGFIETDGDSPESATIPDYDRPWASDPIGMVKLHGAKVYVKRLLKLCGIRNRRKEKKTEAPKEHLPDKFCEPMLAH